MATQINRVQSWQCPTLPNQYTVSKLACEYLVSLAAKSVGMRFSTLRISAPYGPHLQIETVVKRFIQQAARKKQITLMGTGSRSQDFVYEEDVARAFAMAISHRTTWFLDLSGDRSVSMLVLAETILRLFDVEPENAIRLEGIDPEKRIIAVFSGCSSDQSFQLSTTGNVGRRVAPNGTGLGAFMKIGIVADIHANLPALQAVFADMPPVDLLICCGDVVGYYPDVNEVCALFCTRGRLSSARQP